MPVDDDLKEIIAEINRAISDDDISLNDWESKFFNRVSEKVQRGRELTPNEDAALLGLWRRSRGGS